MQLRQMGAAVQIAILQPMTFFSDPMASWLATILLAVPALVPALGLGGTPSDQPSQFVRLFEARYRAARTLRATFLEEYKENGRIVRTEAGTAYFRRPGKMRWEYESPEKDIFLVDGKTAWFYVPGDHTVMRVPAKESSDWRTPLALLAGEMKVSRVCARVDVADAEKAETEANVVLRCRVRGAASAPRNAATGEAAAPQGAQDDTVLFEISRATGALSRLVIRQSGGVQVEFRFTNWQTNPPVSEAMFHFQVPVGVAIVNGELPAGEADVK